VAKNFSQIKTALADWLDLDTTELPDAIRGDAVNTAIKEILRKLDLRFGETSDTFVTVAGTRSYALPSLWRKAHTLWYIHPSNASIVFLDYKDKEEFDSLFPDSTKTGLPSHYTIWGANFQLGKTPDQVLTINRNYQAYLADLVTTSAETNAFTEAAWEVILFNSFQYVMLHGIEDERIAGYKAKGEELLMGLMVEHAQARSAGRKAQSNEPG
jgi:hypothetical protein